MTGFYDRHTGALMATTVYADAHEYAHQHQHATGTLPWRAWIAGQHLPVIGPLTLLAVEIEAATLALLELHGQRILTKADVKEAVRGVLTYCAP